MAAGLIQDTVGRDIKKDQEKYEGAKGFIQRKQLALLWYLQAKPFISIIPPSLNTFWPSPSLWCEHNDVAGKDKAGGKIRLRCTLPNESRKTFAGSLRWYISELVEHREISRWPTDIQPNWEWFVTGWLESQKSNLSPISKCTPGNSWSNSKII